MSLLMKLLKIAVGCSKRHPNSLTAFSKQLWLQETPSIVFIAFLVKKILAGDRFFERCRFVLLQ